MIVKLICFVMIVGGGMAGWMIVVVMFKIFVDYDFKIVFIEFEQIGMVGVGEVIILQILLFNWMLGIDENVFIKVIQVIFKLGIEFEGWCWQGYFYFYLFGLYGSDMDGVMFYYFWFNVWQCGYEVELLEFCLQVFVVCEGCFLCLVFNVKNLLFGYIVYVFQFDVGFYVKYLCDYVEVCGVEWIEGCVEYIFLYLENGYFVLVSLQDG